MELILEPYKCLCVPNKFIINGIEAYEFDFGRGADEDPDNAHDYGCGNRVFTGKPPENDVLEKYKITEEEYTIIVEKLETVLSFGNCGRCIIN